MILAASIPGSVPFSLARERSWSTTSGGRSSSMIALFECSESPDRADIDFLENFYISKRSLFAPFLIFFHFTPFCVELLYSW